MSLYQPLWRDGRTEGDSIRDAETRYDAIAEQLADLPDGFSLLDVGAQSGYFAVRFAGERHARATAVDGDVQLAEGLRWMGAEQHVQAVHRFLRPGDITAMGPFDVALCLSVLHHVDWWRGMLQELRENCSMLFLEMALPEEELNPATVSWREEALEEVRELSEGKLVCATPGYDKRFLRPMYAVSGLA